MPEGPHKGKPLVLRKRPVQSTELHDLKPQLSSELASDAILVNPFPMDGHWWVLGVPPDGIESLELISQITWSNKDHMHLLLRYQLKTPALAVRFEGGQVVKVLVSDFMLTVNPHEAQGQSTNPRVDGIHTHAFRVIPTQKFLKSVRASSDGYFFSWKLHMSAEEKAKVLNNFIADSDTHSGHHLFTYEDLNCSYFLWKSLMKSLNLFKTSSESSRKTWIQLSRRGKWGVELAKQLQLAPEPSYFFSNFMDWKKETYKALDDFIAINSPENFPIPKGQQLQVPPKRNPLIRALCEKGLVDHHWLPYFLGDKLLFGELVERSLGGKRGYSYHPKSRGILDLLFKNNFLDARTGKLKASKESVRQALQKEFPEGYVVKRVIDANSGRTGILNPEEFLLDLFSKTPQTYQPRHLATPFTGKQYSKHAVVTGERFFAMGKVPGTRWSNENTQLGEQSEYRVHSFSQSVVQGAVQNRWDHFENAHVAQESMEFVQNFMACLPSGLFWRQAFSFDVANLGDGEKRIIEMNTNRGRVKPWSDFLRDPRVLGAYVTSAERIYGCCFQGQSGQILREGLGNIKNHIVSEVLYFDWKMGNESYDMNFISDCLQKENLGFLERLNRYRNAPEETSSKYLESFRGFAEDYASMVLSLRNDPETTWKKLRTWATDLVNNNEAG